MKDFLKAEDLFLMVIDPQEKLMAVIDEADRVTKNIALLLHLAKVFSLPVVPTTQYEKGLGPYVAPLKELIEEYQTYDKTEFSAFKNEAISSACKKLGRKGVLLCGVETHICVYQTALSAKLLGYEPLVVADATSSRTKANMEYGLSRLRDLGVGIYSTEMVIYELLEKAGTPAFKALLPHLK